MRDVLVGWVVPAEIIDTVSEVDVSFVEDSGPLEWSLYAEEPRSVSGILFCNSRV